jgi:methionine-rich copper-binding protein CopC
MNTLRPTRWLLAVAAVAVLSTIGVGGPAQAHDSLVSSEPTKGAVLTTLPDQFSVTMNEPLLDLAGESRGFAMLVRGPDGLYYGNGCVSIQGATMSTAPALGPAGAYTLDWQLISTDSHSVSGDIPFTWQPTSADVVVSEGSATPPVCANASDTPNESAPTQAAPPADTPAETASPAPKSDTVVSTSDALWIGGGIGLAGIAALVTILVLTRRKGKA